MASRYSLDFGIAGSTFFQEAETPPDHEIVENVNYKINRININYKVVLK